MQTDVPLLEEIKSLPKKGTVEKGSSAVAQHLTGGDKSLTCLAWGGGEHVSLLKLLVVNNFLLRTKCQISYRELVHRLSKILTPQVAQKLVCNGSF